MSSLMTSMWTGVTGLRVNQSALHTTAHNLSNINTEGYTRQQVLMTNAFYNRLGNTHLSPLQVGLGSTVEAIRQVRDIFLDRKWRTESGRMGFYEVQSEAATEVETVFGEFGDSTFGDIIDNLWGALSDLAQEPDSIVKRSVLTSTAYSFVNYAKLMSEQLKEYQKKVDGKIQAQVDRVNEIGDQIYELNKKISSEEISGQNANDYRDARNMLLDELAGYVNITYSEDVNGMVSVSIEGGQFVTPDRVYHLAMTDSASEEKVQIAQEINEKTEDLFNAIVASKGNLDAVRTSDEWKALSEYGSLSIQKLDENSNSYVVNFNNMPLIRVEDKGNGNYQAEVVLHYEATPTGFHDVIWEDTGLSVFRLDGDYVSSKNTDIGSLKGTLVARGKYAADYTDIPQKADYCDAEGNMTEDQQKAYEAAVKKYMEDIDACLLTCSQAQLDLLVHDIVTMVNDMLCPNVEMTEERLKALFNSSTDGGDKPSFDPGYTITVTDDNGNIYAMGDASSFNVFGDVMILDELSAGIGMDENETIGEALFNRSSIDRYTKATVTVTVPGKDPFEKTVYIYNKEYETDVHSMFTIDQIEVNQRVMDDVSLLPLSYSKYSELYGGFNFDVCNDILDAWAGASVQISPDVFTPYNFSDFYDAIAGNIGTRGGVYAEKYETSQEAVSSVGFKRESILGVANEEELTNIIMFQHAYGASSRYINAIDELLETVINIGR